MTTVVCPYVEAGATCRGCGAVNEPGNLNPFSLVETLPSWHATLCADCLRAAKGDPNQGELFARAPATPMQDKAATNRNQEERA